MRYLKLTLAYQGGAFAGWQFQPQQRTVQGVVEDAWRQITGETLRIGGASRTDAGVHAVGQIASLATHSALPAATLCRALNAVLPFDVAVRDVAEAPAGFLAVRDAYRKCYRYLIQDGGVRDVFLHGRAWRLPKPLRDDPMREAAALLVGTHDFASFQSHGAERETTVRTVFRLHVERVALAYSQCLALEIEADGFLYNMVRNIVGTLVHVGNGKSPVSWVPQVLAARDRRSAGMTAPAAGLCLMRVDCREPNA